MPRELSASEEVAYSRYLGFGSPDEIQKIRDDNATLKSENADRRQKVKELEGELATARAAVPEGAKVLTADEAKAWERYVALGTPDEAEALKKERDELAAKDATRTRQDILTAASPTEGWNENAPKALLKLAGFDAVELTAGEVTVERAGTGGKKENVKAPTAFVTVDGKQVRISEWLAKEAPEFVPLLTAQASNGNGASSGGITVPEQRGNAGNSPTVRTQEDHAKAVTSRVDYSV